VAKDGVSVIWTGDLAEKLGRVDDTARRAMSLACRVNAPRIEGWMKSNAPWTDRTGNARNSLAARHQVVGKDSDVITLSGSVPYQLWLEVRWSGRYAIIGPAIQHWGPLVMSSVAKYVGAAMSKP
jgi:hypothetical protein